MTFSTGEERLSQWLDKNARVVWKICEAPLTIEEELIGTLDLPLNLDQNARNAFFPVLTELRRAAKGRARALPILSR
jgi:hypothetical protein